MAEDKKIGITVKKEDNFSEWYTQLVEQAELADIRYNIKGFVVYRAWSTITIEKMFRAMSDELEKNGHMPLTMPTLIPEKNFHIEAEHVEGFAPEVFWVTETGNGNKLEEKYALRPTSETAFYQMYSLWIRSYRDLPFKRYQRGSVFRAEKTKGTRPFFRGREFHWIEAHNVFATEEEARNQVKEDMEMTYDVLYKQFGIPHLFFERPQWDKFPGAESTFAADALMGSGKVLQLPSTHLLGQNFSKPFNVKFLDKDGKKKYAYITCYGPAISRIYGAMIALHSDNKGLRLPFNFVPQQIVIIPIGAEKDKKVTETCKELEKQLKSYTVSIDERDETPGWKFNQWELKGVPIRIEVGPNDVKNKTAVIVRRDTNTKETVDLKSVTSTVKKIEKEFTKNLIKQAEQSFDANTVEASTIDEIKKALGDNKIVKCCFCNIDMDVTEKARELEEKVGAEIRGVRMDKKEKAKGKCILSNKKANCVVYIAKSY